MPLSTWILDFRKSAGRTALVLLALLLLTLPSVFTLNTLLALAELGAFESNFPILSLALKRARKVYIFLIPSVIFLLS